MTDLQLPLDVPTARFDLPVHRWRFLFTDGGILDVLSSCSDVRLTDFAYLTYYGHPIGGNRRRNGDDPDRIVGWTDLGEVEP